MQSQKRQNDLCSFPKQTIQYLVTQVYAPTSNAEEAEVEQFYEDLQDLLELTPQKNVLFIIGDWNAKVGSPETPGSEVKLLSLVQLFATPWTVAHQAPLSMGFTRQEYWSELPFRSPGDLPNPGIEARSPTLQADALTSEPPGNRQIWPWNVE